MMKPQPGLSEVLYWFALEGKQPTAALVNEYRLRFPEHAEAITEFAIELSVDALRADEHPEVLDAPGDPPSAAVMAAISRFQNLLFDAEQERQRAEQSADVGAEESARADPFSVLWSHQRYRQFARDIGVTSLFALKLKERQIRYDTIPPALTQRIATTLGVPIDALAAYLSRPPGVQAPAALFFKSTEKPKRQPQETFEEAVRTSNLSAAQQEALLQL